MTEREMIEELAYNLKAMIHDSGMNQKELSKASKIAESTISQYIKGERKPSIKNLINIAYALECDIEDLLPTYELIR